jgi:hypothetical protein
MPTPTATFLEIAARYGDVDPEDIEAVQHWFTEVLPGLPPERIEEILDDLLASEGADKAEETVRSYPRDVPLPALSSSPPVPIPLLAERWREILARLAGRGRRG